MSEIDKHKIGEHYEISYIIFKDSKGKEHLIAKETIELWKKTFKLKSIDDEYIPNIPQKLKDFLGKDKIFIGKSTLFTLVAKQYHNAIPQVKQMLKLPEIIITNGKSQSLHYKDYILAKFINDKAYFLNMRIFESGDCLVSISNGRKKLKEFKKNIEKLKTAADGIIPHSNTQSQTHKQNSARLSKRSGVNPLVESPYKSKS